MTTSAIGIRSQNAIIPYVSTVKSTKWIRVTDASHITITGTGFTSSTIRGAYIRATADSNNVWRLEFNVDVTKAAGTGARTSATLTFVSPYAVVFRNLTQFFQAVSVYDDSTAIAISGEANPNASTVSISHASSDIAQYSVSGACILESEPTWAAANMEGVLAADVWIPPASASVAGIVDTGAQSFAGVKAFTNGISLGNETLSTYDEATHISTWGGGAWTTTANKTIYMVRVGKMVTLNIPTITATIVSGSANAITMTTVLPAGYRPDTVSPWALVRVNLAGNGTGPGMLQIGTDGSIIVYRDLVSTGVWGVSTNNGFEGISVSYVVP